MLQRMAKLIQNSISSSAYTFHAYGKLQVNADADTLATDAVDYRELTRSGTYHLRDRNRQFILFSRTALIFYRIGEFSPASGFQKQNKIVPSVPVLHAKQ